MWRCDLISGRRDFREDILMKYVVALVATLAVAIGVAGFVYGEADDSPGLRFLSALIVIGAVALGVRTARRGS